MTQEHREQFLAMDGWQKTERGHIRGPEFGQIVLTYTNFQHVATVPTSRKSQSSRKFRRFPFGRKPKHDALVGWKIADDRDDEAMEKYGGLRELNQMAERDAKNNGKDSERHVGKFDWILDGWWYYNKRQGWKTIEVGDGEKKEKVVVEVMG